MTAAIRTRDLVKTYGSTIAVAEVDLDVNEGEIVAFLGPNGAGKTTTIEILEGFRSRTSGSVEVLGVDPASAPLEWRERIGIVLQESEPVPELTAAEAVRMQGHYYRNPRSPGEILDLVGLAEAADVRTRRLSGGQARRLDLALALVGDPELVFLDEPTTGFDPSARRDSWAMIEALRDLGRTVLLTTHYMDEAEHLADRIVVIAGGRIVAKGTADELATEVGAKPTISWQVDPTNEGPPDRLGWTVDAGVASIETDEVVEVVNALTTWALTVKRPLANLSVSQPTLEDIYLRLTAGADSGSVVETAS